MVDGDTLPVVNFVVTSGDREYLLEVVTKGYAVVDANVLSEARGVLVLSDKCVLVVFNSSGKPLVEPSL